MKPGRDAEEQGEEEQSKGSIQSGSLRSNFKKGWSTKQSSVRTKQGWDAEEEESRTKSNRS